MTRPEGIILNDPSMTICPTCIDDGAIVKLVKGEDGCKYCPLHGRMTERKR